MKITEKSINTSLLVVTGMLLGGCLAAPLSAESDTGFDDMAGDSATLIHGENDVGVTDGDWGDLDDTSPDATIFEDMPPDLPVEVDAWGQRVRFVLDNNFATFTDFKVRLDITAYQAAALGSGFDKNVVRFTDDSGSPLAHELEYSSTGAAFWVKTNLPKEKTYIWMYFDTANTVPTSQKAQMWTNYTAVYHFDGDGTDACQNNDLSCAGDCSGSPGIGVGSAFSPSGTGTFQIDDIGAAMQIGVGQARTISFWYKPGGASNVSVPLMSAMATCVGWGIRLNASQGIDAVFATLDPQTQPGGSADNPCDLTSKGVSAGPLASGEFHHVVLTIDRASNPGRLELWVDGASKDDTPLTSALASASASTFVIGGDEAGGRFANGTFDEVRVRSGVTSKEEIRAHYLNFGPNGWVRLEPNSVEALTSGR